MTEIWGPAAWKFLHYVTFAYPEYPTNEDVQNYYAFFNTIQYILPCAICKKHFSENLKKYPVNRALENGRLGLVEWLVVVHNSVNRMHGKPEWTMDEVMEEYYKEQLHVKEKMTNEVGGEVGDTKPKFALTMTHVLLASVLVGGIIILRS